MNAVREGQADFAISILDAQYEMSGLDVAPVGVDELVLVCASSSPVPNRALTPKDISGMTFVTAQRHSARRMIEDGALLKLGIVPSGGPQADVQAKLPNEMKRWADVIVKGNIKPS
jgi:DNA-binding transcriptional LysR family regulator